MTPPRPTAPTAAELRERFASDYGDFDVADVGHPGYHDGSAEQAEFVADLDALLAAARAEAVAEEVALHQATRDLLAAEREALHERFLDWRGIEPGDACQRCYGAGQRAYANTAIWRGGIGGQAITSGVCDGCWGTGSATRKGADLRKLERAMKPVAEAVAPVLAVLRQLVAACHKCANCESPAMRKAANEALYCDAHGYYLSGTQMDDHRIAAPLRAALALLAADQAGEKAGKP